MLVKQWKVSVLFISFNLNKMLQTTKVFSKSLKKLVNKANPQQREVTLYFQRSQSTHKPTLPSLAATSTHNGPLFRQKAHSQKIRTEPAQTSQLPFDQQHDLLAPPSKEIYVQERQPSLAERVDDIMYDLIERGEARVDNIRGMRESFEKKRLKNLRILTEESEPRHSHKRSRANQEMETMMIHKEVSRERLLRRKFLQQNPQVQKKVSTRWGKGELRGINKELSYYPMVDIRQENEELLQNMPARSEEYIRKLRQSVIARLKRH